MSTTIDERVVSMAFDNAKFEAGIAQTMRSLSKLDAALQQVGAKNGLQDIEKAASKVTLEQPMSALEKLKARFGRAGEGAADGFNEIEKSANKVTLEQPMSALDKLRARLGRTGEGAADGFNEIEKASNHVSLNGLTKSLDTVTAKFSVLQGAATVALGNITSQALHKGASFAKGFALGPINQGLEEYKTNLGSIQTILANTEGQRVSGLGEVNKHLAELNKYSDQTIYNFSQMAKNIGTFTAAGVDLDKSTQSIKGIANLAALSGSSSQQASTAMYQLSQAIAAGRVGLQDWNSVVNAGMGGAKFQQALMRTAENMGAVEKGAVKIDKATGKATVNGESFRNSIMAAPGQESWLTSDVLTNTLQQFTGDMTDAELAAQGFTQEQIKAIQAQAKTAKNAATEVKTLSQVFDVAKESIGSGWAKTFQLIFGDFKEAKTTFTELSNFLSGIIGNSAKARNDMLADWKKLGGRDVLIEGIKNAFKALEAVLKPIHDAFRDIFPAKTGRDLFNMTKGFADLMERLKPSKEVVDGLHRTFRGLFAALSIGWYVVKKIIGVITDLLGFAGDGAGGLLAFTGGVGDFVVALQKAVVEGDALGGVFQGITNVLRVPLEIVKALAEAFFGLFEGVDSGKVAAAGDSVKGLGDKLKPMEEILARIKEAAKKTINFVNKLFEPFSKFVSGLGKMFANIGTTIADAFKGANSDQIIKVIQTGLLGGIFVALKKGISGGDFFINPLKEISGVMDTMTNSLKAMQAAVKAGTILAIGTAIVALAGGVKILSTIDGDKLKVAMTAVAIGLGQLVAALAFLEGATTLRASASLPLIATAMIGLATAVTILAGAMKIFATMSWDEIERGLVGVAGALAAIGVGVKTMGGIQLTAMAPGLLAVAVAMNVLAVAMKIFGGMEWEEIAKGIVGLGAGLAALSVGLEGIQRSVIVVGPGLIAAGLGVAMLAGAVSAFGNQDLLKMIQGTIGMAGALTLLSEAMWRMPPGPMLAGQAAGLVILSVALTGIAGAIKIMGGMDIATIAKGLVTMGAAMYELAIGLDLMAGTAPGALALLGAAAAFAVLGPAIAFMGVLNWGTIFKGLAAMAGALLVMATVGAVAAPALAAIGAALIFLGVAVIALGAGVYLIAKALIMLGDASVKSTGILIAAITAFVAAIPKMVIDFLKGLVEVIAGIAEIAPKIVDSLVKIIDSILDVIIKSTPKLAEAIGVLVSQIFKVIVRDSPKLIAAGMQLIENLLKGIDNHIESVVNRVTSIITKFLGALANNAPALTAAGGRALTQFLIGIARQIPDVVAAGVRVVVNFLRGVAKGLPKIVDAVVNAVIKFVDAVGERIPDVVKAGVRLAARFVHAAAKGLVKLAREGADAIIDFMHGIADVIRDKGPELMAAGADIAAAIVEGFIGGLADMQGVLSNALNEAIFNNEGPGSDAWNAEVKNLRNLQSKGHSRRDIEKMQLGYKPGQLDEVFGPRRKVAADAKARGKETTHKFAEGAKEGSGEIKVAVDKGLEPLKKPTVMGPLDPKPMLKQAATDLNPEAPEVKKVVKEVSPLGIKLGGHLVNGLKAGLRGVLPIMASGIAQPIGIMLQQTKSMREFGKFLGGEFRQGLNGGLWDDGKSDARRQIEGSFKALRAKLSEENGKLRTSLKEDQDQLKQLMSERDKDWGKINALQARIANERRLLAQSKDASDALMRGMRGEQTILIKLAANYEAITAKLEKAKNKLNALKSDRTNAIKQFRDQFGQLPDLGGLIDKAANEAAMTWAERWDALRTKQKEDQQRSQLDQVAIYRKGLQEQITATLKYNETLAQLRAAGLDDVTYKKLLEMGTAGQEFASQLLRGGPGAISAINALDEQLKKAAGDLSKTAGNELYNAGISAAQGIVDGLKKKRSEIREAMQSIAQALVTALKLSLQIRSPSRVMAELGQYTVQGLAEGLVASSDLVTSAAGGIGDEAADALSKSLAGISERVQNEVDTDVTITPVLDLSQVQKDAGQLKDLADVVPITAAASYGQAAAVQEQTQASDAAQAEAAGQTVIDFKFEQNNTSPKALDDIEIYRQTKNLTSQVKSALGLVTAAQP